MFNPIDRLVRHSIDREKMYVQKPHLVRRVLITDLIVFAITLTCWVIWPMFVGTPLSVVIGIIVGLQLGRTAILSTRRAATYRSGWLDGRMSFVATMKEAQDRGMSPAEWLAAEFSRDMAVLGETVDVDELLRRVHGDDS